MAGNKETKTTKDVLKEVKEETKPSSKEMKTDAKSTKKRMIKVSFTGKELLEGTVFDTTSAEEAKKAGAFDPKRKYHPLTIIVGEMEMLPKVEKELEGMKAGENKKIKLSTKEGFGDRDTKFVIVMPLKNFIDQKINAVPGLIIRGEMNGQLQTGKVQSVSGGRVRVDFNHPLAGRELEYEIKVEKEITDKKEIAAELFTKYYSILPGAKHEIKNDELYITLPVESFNNLKKVNDAIADLGTTLGIKINFSQEEKPAKTEAKKAVVEENKNTE
jgi:FKBP-type peptidyl-prolyl cis-trans isomerase 2